MKPRDWAATRRFYASVFEGPHVATCYGDDDGQDGDWVRTDLSPGQCRALAAWLLKAAAWAERKTRGPHQ